MKIEIHFRYFKSVSFFLNVIDFSIDSEISFSLRTEMIWTWKNESQTAKIKIEREQNLSLFLSKKIDTTKIKVSANFNDYSIMLCVHYSQMLVLPLLRVSVLKTVWGLVTTREALHVEFFWKYYSDHRVISKLEREKATHSKQQKKISIKKNWIGILQISKFFVIFVCA